MVYVIVDTMGYYISPREAGQQWFCLMYTGKATGFVYYTILDTAQYEMGELIKLGHELAIEYIA